MHDIAYEKYSDSSERHRADEDLKSEAFKRVFAKDSSLGERAAALAVTSAMKAKTSLTKVGKGIPKTKRKHSIKKNVPKKIMTKKKKTENLKQSKMSFKTFVKKVENNMNETKPKTVKCAVKKALQAADMIIKGKKLSVPKTVKLPEFTGGMLPIVPILAGLSAVGSLIGGASGVVKTINDIKNSRKQLEEQRHHSLSMEQKIGKGLYLAPFRKKGYGLYLRPAPKTKNY